MACCKTDLLDNTMAFLDGLWEMTRCKDTFALRPINTLQKLIHLFATFDFLEPILSFILQLLLFEPFKYTSFIHGLNHIHIITRSKLMNLLTVSGLTKRHHSACCTSLANISHTLHLFLWCKTFAFREIIDVGYSKAFLKAIFRTKDF